MKKMGVKSTEMMGITTAKDMRITVTGVTVKARVSP